MQITMRMSSTPSKHLAQILVGWAKWLKRNRETAKIDYFDNHAPEYDFVLAVEFADKKIIYDVADGYMKLSVVNELLDWCDSYFKRSCNKIENQRYHFPEKIYPLGFNFYMADSSLAKISMNLLDYYDVISGKDRLKQLIKYFLTGKTHLCEPWIFEKRKKFDLESKPKILFYTRIWTSMHPEETDPFVHSIDKTRIEIIEALRSEWGGGIAQVV